MALHRLPHVVGRTVRLFAGPALARDVGPRADDAVRELFAVHERAAVVAVAVGVKHLLTRDEHAATIELELELLVPIVGVGHDEGCGDARVGRAAVVARPGLSADVAAHGRDFGCGCLVGFHARGLGRGDPEAAIAGGVDREPVGEVRGEGEVAEGEVVLVRRHVLGRARGHRVGVGGDEVGRTVFERAVRQHDLRSGEAPHRRRIAAGVVAAGGAVLGVLVGADGLVARAALAGGAVAAHEGEAEGEDAGEGTGHRSTRWP